MSDGLTSMLKKLRLSGLGESLEIRLHEASSRGLTHREFLELALQDELLVRDGRQISRRIASACFRDVKRLEEFDFTFNTSIKKNRIFDLATCHFIRDKRDVLWLGPPGTGKSHLCQSIGVAAIRSGFTVYYRSIFDTVRDFLHDEAMEGHEKILQRYLKPDLLIVDDMGMKQLPKRSGEYLFEIIMRRHELRSTMMTSIRANGIFHLFLFTGCRVGDLVSLELSDVMLAERSGTVVFRNAKGNKQRSVPLPLQARRAMQAYLETRPPVASGNVFVGERGRLSDRGVRNLCSKYAAICGSKFPPASASPLNGPSVSRRLWQRPCGAGPDSRS